MYNKLNALAKEIGEINKNNNRIGLQIKMLCREYDSLVKKYLESAKKLQDARPILARLQEVTARKAALFTMTAQSCQNLAAIELKAELVIKEITEEYTQLYLKCNPPN